MLRRHVRLFHGWGYVVIAVTVPTSVVFAPRVSAAVEFCKSLLVALARLDGGGDERDGKVMDGGMVLMCMSTAGAMLAYGLARLFSMVDGCKNIDTSQAVQLDGFLKRTILRTRASLAAVVFDSGPARMHDVMGGHAFAMGQGVDPTSITGITLRAVHKVYSVTRRWIFDDLPSNFWEWLSTANYGGCPELYIFSDGDAMLDVDALIQLVKKRKDIGRTVQTLQVDNIDHVAILKRYTKMYEQTLATFLDFAIGTHRTHFGLSAWMHDNAKTKLVMAAKL